MIQRISPMSPDELSNLLGYLPKQLDARFKLCSATDLSDLSARVPILNSIKQVDVEFNANVERGALLELYALQLQDKQYDGVNLELLSIESRGENLADIIIQPTIRELKIWHEFPMPQNISKLLKHLPNELKVELYQSKPNQKSVFVITLPPSPRLSRLLSPPPASEVVKISPKAA